MIRLALVNIAVFLFLFVVGDLGLGLMMNIPVKYTCADERLHHKYCSSSTRVYPMTESDGGRTIKSYWNKQGLRVKNYSEKFGSLDVSTYDIVNVGDSFMAQRQVDYDERVSSVLQELTGLRVLQAGTGSWAPVIYKHWILDQSFKEGVVVNMFVMNNDFYAFGYTMSNSMYYKSQGYVEDPIPHFKVTEKTSPMEAFLMNNSFVYQKLFLDKKYRSFEKYDRYHSLSSSIEGIRMDCSTLEMYKDKVTPYTYSNVLYAYDSKCWPTELWENVDTTIEDIREVNEYLKKFKGTLNVFFIPDGWAFEYESQKVANHPIYQIGENITISNLGLVTELKKQITCCHFVDLTQRLKERKKQIKGQFYYPYDGHWNKKGSRVVAEIVREEVSLQ